MSHHNVALVKMSNAYLTIDFLPLTVPGPPESTLLIPISQLRTQRLERGLVPGALALKVQVSLKNISLIASYLLACEKICTILIKI